MKRRHVCWQKTRGNLRIISPSNILLCGKKGLYKTIDSYWFLHINYGIKGNLCKLGAGWWHVLTCLLNHSVENIGWCGTTTKIPKYNGQPTKMKTSNWQPKRYGNQSNQAMICRTRLLVDESSWFVNVSCTSSRVSSLIKHTMPGWHKNKHTQMPKKTQTWIQLSQTWIPLTLQFLYPALFLLIIQFLLRLPGSNRVIPVDGWNLANHLACIKPCK